MEIKITMDLIRELEKDKEGRILLRDLRRSTELWQDYDEVKREVREAKEKKKMKHTSSVPCAAWHMTFGGKCLNCGGINNHSS